MHLNCLNLFYFCFPLRYETMVERRIIILDPYVFKIFNLKSTKYLKQHKPIIRILNKIKKKQKLKKLQIIYFISIILFCLGL